MPSSRFLILATYEGICRFSVRQNGSLGTLRQVLRKIEFEAMTRDASGGLYAGADQGQIYRSEDQGLKWKEVFQGFPASRGLWSLVAHPVRPKEIYAGLEPASLWISRDGGAHWDELTALRDHPSGKKWYFYDPAQPHVRTISFDRQGDRLFIGIEVGGILASQDGGGSFESKGQGVDEDMHNIQMAPNNPDLVFAMTGDGLYRSRDGGDHWEQLSQGIERWYFIPLAFVSADARHLCVGAGNTPPGDWSTVGADAAIYWSEDKGNHWKMSEGPFPLRGMVTSIVADPEDHRRLFAGTTDGTLLRSPDGGKHWAIAARDLSRIEEMVISG